MRYALLLHNDEPAPGDIPDDVLQEAQQAFRKYAADLVASGVFLSAEILQPSTASTTVSRQSGELMVQDGPFHDVKQRLAGVFLIEVPDLDAALAWAERCPGAGYGVVEVRPAAISYDPHEGWQSP
jgi:hypothetical protein